MSKIWLISDTHFGVRNNSKKWEELMCSWMNDYFFPLVDSNIEKDDVIVHLGDVFDNRQSVSLSSMNVAIEFFERLSEHFSKTYVICGNHDSYYTTRNDITSLECLKHIPNVNVIKKPIVETIFDKKILFMPWTENKSFFENTIKENSPDILLCHTEFSGCIMNSSGTKSDNNFEIPNVFKVYTGHIHHRQKLKNVTYIGSPYQLTQNDRDNAKGVWIYDPAKNEEHFYFNDNSPEFTRLKYENISEMTLHDFKQICKNKFVEIETNHSLMAKCNFQKLLSLIQDADIMDLTFMPAKTSKEEKNVINISDCVSIQDMLEKYIDECVYCDVSTKKSVKLIAKKLINE